MVNNIALLYLIGILLYQTAILDTMILTYIASVFLLFKALKLNYKKKEIYYIIFFLLLTFFSKNPKLLFIILFILQISRLEEKEVESFIYSYFKYGLLIYVCIITLAYFNIIDTKYFVYSSTKIRNGLGFKNPNTPGIYYFFIISHYYFYRWNKLKIYEILLVLLGYIILYKFSMSRTNLIIGYFQTITIISLKGKINLKKIRKYYWILPIIFYIFTFLIAFFYNEKLNKIMTTRPWTWKMNILNNMNILNIFLGSFGEKAVYPLDNSFLSVQYYNGVIAIIVLLLTLSFGLKNIEKKNIEKCFILLMSYLLYSLSEDMLFSLNFGIIQFYIMAKNFNIKYK